MNGSRCIRRAALAAATAAAVRRRSLSVVLALNGVAPRLEVHGLGLITNHAYSGPY